MIKDKIVPAFIHDKRNEGWKLISDVGFDPILTSLKDIELVSCFKRGEKYIGGREFVRRARNLKANLGQRHAEFFLKHQKRIPKQFRRYELDFTGTIWLDSSRHPVWRDHGRLRVPCLRWEEPARKWELDFKWVNSRFLNGKRFLNPSTRLMRLRQKI